METGHLTQPMGTLGSPAQARRPHPHLPILLRCLLILSHMALCALPSLVEAASLAPDWLAQITPLTRRADARIQPLRLVYDVSWSNWLQAGRIRLAFDPTAGKDALIRGQATARSSGAVRAFWPYDSATLAEIAAQTLLPLRVEHVETERGETSAYAAREHNGSLIVRSLPESSDGKEAERQQKAAYPFAPIRGVLSTILYLQQSNLRTNREIVLLVQPKERLYQVSFKYAGQEQREVLGTRWQTTRLEVSIAKITDDFALAPYDQLRKATLWLSNTADQVPVELHADLLVGFISVRLASIE